MTDRPHKSGYAAIIGKPNVGKSTLMIRLLRSKISITTHKPQTTRHQVVGIYSDDDTQIVFLDTPGVISPKYELQKAMMKTVERARSEDRKSTRLNSSHVAISYAVLCLKKKTKA